jgi:hypothetical protein
VPFGANPDFIVLKLVRAGQFTWRAATEQFFSHLHPRLNPQNKQLLA